MISGAKKRFTPNWLINRLANHELSHAREDTEGPGVFGLLVIVAVYQVPEIINRHIEMKKKEVEHVVGAFYQWIGERSAKARKAIASAPGSDRSDQDRFIESLADQDLKQEEYMEWLQNSFEETETSTHEKNPFEQDQDQQQYQVDQPQWFTTQTSGEKTEIAREEKPQESPEFSPLPEEVDPDLYEIFSTDIASLFEIETEEQRLILFSLFQDFLHEYGLDNKSDDQQDPTPEELTQEFVKSLYEPHFSNQQEQTQDPIQDFFAQAIIVHLTSQTQEKNEESLISP